MKQLIFISFSFLNFLTLAQNYTLPNENIILEFKTLKGKMLVIALDSDENYLVYRYGTSEKVELTFPNNLTESWTGFQFSYYMRGGGIQNEGLELDYLYFDIENYRYVVYQEYYSGTQKVEHGIKVINRDTNKKTILKANEKTVKGNLSKLRDCAKLKVGEELF